MSTLANPLSAQLKETCDHVLKIASQFLNFATAGIAITISIAFTVGGQLRPWLVVAACIIFGLSIVMGLMVRIVAVLDIHKLGSCDVSRAQIKTVTLLQILLFLAGVALLASATFSRALPQVSESQKETPPAKWISTGEGLTEGISGLALVEHDSARTVLLAVHDNKAQEQPRFSLVTRHAEGGRLERRHIPWPDALPSDLEALCRIPHRGEEFLALTSKGALFRIAIDGSRAGIVVLARGQLPDTAETAEIEALGLQDFGGNLVACWADRGDGEQPAKVFCASLDLTQLTFGPVTHAMFRSPWPQTRARHLSDLRLTSTGAVLAVATSDPGNDGPFASALYLAGRIEVGQERLAFLPEDALVRIWQDSTHKVEAMEQIPGATGGLVFGSDDESRGGALLFTW